MLHQKLHKHIKKHAKRIHKHVQDHWHKRLSLVGIAFLIILIYPYFSNAQVPETCTNGAVDFPTCATCDEWYILDESEQCVEDTQEPESILILGCTDEEAMNYDPLATFDDGTCIPLTAETIELTWTVEYSPTTSTTGSVTATVTGFSTTWVTVTSTGWATHTFTGNGSFTFTFENTDGATGSAVATVDWITGSVGTGWSEQETLSVEECLAWDVSITQPTSGSIVGATFPISWTSEESCDQETEITIQLRDHNGQWIDIGTGTLGDTGVDFVSTGLVSTGFYTVTWVHLSGSSYTDGSTWVYTQDTIYNIYTGAYTGLYTDFATGYKIRIIDDMYVILGESDGTFTIDNKKANITWLTIVIDNGTNVVTSWTIGLAWNIVFSLTADEQLSGASFTVLWTYVLAETGSQSGNTYTYTVPLETVTTSGALAYTAHLVDMAGNTTNVYGTSTVVFDNHIPSITNFSLTGSTGSIGLWWKTDVDTRFTFTYNKTGTTAQTSYTSTVYGTMHNYTMSWIQNNNTYNFTLSARNNLGNTKLMSGAIAVSTTGALQLTVYQNNGSTLQLSQQVELELYNQILQREIDKFQACKASITINKQTIKIGDKDVEVQVPVIEKNSVKNIVQAFLLFFINKTKNTTMSQAELNEVVLRMNNFFLIVKLLRDDDGTCQQNMSNYYIAQFEQIMTETRSQ